jgi:hypothetical protein
MIRLVWLGFALGTASWSLPARADLGADVAALSKARAAYGRVVRLKPRLLERGERLSLSVPPELLNPKDSSCATVTILGVPEAHFVIRFSELDPGAPSTAFPEASAAGASEVTRCGSSKPYLSAMVLEMRSPRGVLETLLSTAPAGAPKLVEILKARDPGVELGLGEPGDRPALPALSQRMQRLAARARREGALSFQRAEWQAGEDGSGTGPLSLTAGCHELTLLAEAAPVSASVAVDLDIELVDTESGARLAIDRGDDADATVSYCTGETAALELRFVGAAPSSSLTLAHARWDLPAGLPSAWGPEARAAFGRLARSAHFQPQNQPIYQSLGVQGTTELPLEVEPDACYTALLAPLRGEARALSLSAYAHMPGQLARGASDTEGSSVSFCARGATNATLEVEGDGSNLAWLLAVWQTGRAPLESEEH